MDESTSELDLPGFRFHPTEEELLEFYLKNIIFDKKMRFDIIGFLNIYRHDPWHLPELAKIGEREWYFFVPRDRKHGSGGRPNRTTENGFWKATGSDRKILSLSDPKRMIGLKKTLVFYKGRAPRGCKTDWVMNEYRLPDTCNSPKDIVLCKIYRKATSLKELEQRAALGEEIKSFQVSPPLPSSPPPMESITFSSQPDDSVTLMRDRHVAPKEERVELHIEEDKNNSEFVEEVGRLVKVGGGCSSLQLPEGKEKLAELQVPAFNMDWSQDPFWSTMRSPWLDYLTPHANVLNF